MFSKLTICLVMTMSFTMAGQAFAQATKQETKKESKAKKSTTKAKNETAPKVEETTTPAPAVTPAPTPAPAAAVAATPAAPTEKDPVIAYVKEKFTFSYHGEFYYKRLDPLSADKEDRKLQDTFIMHNPTITYSPIKDLKFLATSEFKYTDAPAAYARTYIDRHYRSLVTLTKSNILTDAQHGLKLDFGIGRRIFDRNEGSATVYGNNRAFVSMSKKINDSSLGLFVQYLNNDPAKGKITNSTWKHSLELIPSISLQLTEKLSYFFNDDFVVNTPWRDVPSQNDYSISHDMNIGVLSYQVNETNSSYFQLKYLHFEDFTQYKDQYDWFEYYIGHTINISPKASLTFEIGSELARGSDGRDGLSKKIEYPELALYVDFSL